MSEVAPVASPEAPGAAETPAGAPGTPETPKAAPEGTQAAAVALPEAGSGPGSAAKRLFKITVAGETRELPEEEVIARAQKSEFHEKRSQQLAQKQAQIDKALAGAKENPQAAFDDLAKLLGLNPKEIAQAKLAAELQVQIEQDELAALSPEARKAREERQELERYRKQEQERVKAEKEAAVQAEQAKQQAHFEGVLDKAMEFGLEGTKMAGDPYAQYQFAQLVAITAQDVMDGKLAEMPHPKELAAHLERELTRLAGKYAPPPPPAPAKPAHPVAARPARSERPRDPATGQFKGGPHDPRDFEYEGNQIYEKLAKAQDKATKVQVKRFLHGK